MTDSPTWPDALEVIKDAPQPMIHMYRGLFFGLVYSLAQYEQPGKEFAPEISIEDLNMLFSPSMSQAGPVSFYEEPPPLAEDTETYKFNPLHFLALTASLDAEAGLTYINVRPLAAGKYTQDREYYRFVMYHIEGVNPPPDDIEWRNWTTCHDLLAVDK